MRPSDWFDFLLKCFLNDKILKVTVKFDTIPILKNSTAPTSNPINKLEKNFFNSHCDKITPVFYFNLSFFTSTCD